MVEHQYKGKFFTLSNIKFRVHKVDHKEAECLYVYPNGQYCEFGWIKFKLKELEEAKEITRDEFNKEYIKLLGHLNDMTQWIT